MFRAYLSLNQAVSGMEPRTSFDGPRSSSESQTHHRGPRAPSAILGHFQSITSSIQRRLSGTSSETTSTDTPRHISDVEPPLTPITLSGFSETTTERVLTDKLAEEIRLMMPTRLQLHDNWELVYSLDQHGVSLATLYARCKAFNASQAGFVIVVKDRKDHVFGAYVSDYPHVHPHYYGTGECFLWKNTVIPHYLLVHPPSHSTSPLHSTAHPTIHKHDRPSSSGRQSQSSMEASLLSIHSTADTTRPSSRESDDLLSPQHQFKGFPYTGLNDYMILCTPQFLSVGGGYLVNPQS
jgi:hypothetical protein